jgi:hypothetical protein
MGIHATSASNLPAATPGLPESTAVPLCFPSSAPHSSPSPARQYLHAAHRLSRAPRQAQSPPPPTLPSTPHRNPRRVTTTRSHHLQRNRLSRARRPRHQPMPIHHPRQQIEFVRTLRNHRHLNYRHSSIRFICFICLKTTRHSRNQKAVKPPSPSAPQQSSLRLQPAP